MSGWAKLKRVCRARMVTGEDLSLILSIYAECLEAAEPHAAGEAEAAEMIGLNIMEILGEEEQ